MQLLLAAMPTGKTSSASRDGTRGSKRRAGKSRDSTAPRAKSQAPTAQKKGGGKRGGVGRRASQHQVAGGEEEGKKNRASFRGQSQSCHQCRQSIHSNKGVSEVKSGRERIKCSTCTRFWCVQGREGSRFSFVGGGRGPDSGVFGEGAGQILVCWGREGARFWCVGGGRGPDSSVLGEGGGVKSLSALYEYTYCTCTKCMHVAQYYSSLKRIPKV